MPILVTHDRTVQRFDDRVALDTFMNARGIDSKSQGNLRQLCRFNEIPKDRTKKREVKGFTLLEDTSWFYHRDVAVAVPLFGSQAEQYGALVNEYGINKSKLSLSTFQRMLRDKEPSRIVEGWQRRSAPAAVATLADGASLLNLPAPAVQPTAFTLPNYDAASVSMHVI